MKKVILVIACLAIIIFGGMHFLMPEKTTPHLTQFFSKEHKDVQLIQDWLKYKQQQRLLLVDVASPVSPKQQGAYAEYIKQKIELNQQNIQRLRLTRYQTKAFKELQQLEIHALEQWNTLFQTHIVDAFVEKQNFTKIPAEEYQQFDAETRYALQKQEVLVLEHLQQLLQDNSPYLYDIDHSLLSDWLNYQLMQHEIHPVISESLHVETDMPDRSRQNAMKDLRLYKRFNPNTDEYKYIMSLKTQLWHAEHPSSNLLAQPSNTMSNSDIEIDPEIVIPEDEPQVEQIKKLIETQHENVNRMMFSQLRQSFLK